MTTTAARAVRDHSTITEYPTITGSLAETLWAFYRDTFAEINTLAAQRHLLYESEFHDLCADDRVAKFLAHDKGILIGFSTITNNLRAWPLISPEYFERRYPDRYRRRAIWYIGIVGVAPGNPGVFYDLIADMYPRVIHSDGMFVQDFCAFNVDTRRLPALTRRVVAALNPAAHLELADTQTFWVGDFDGARP